MPDRRKSEIWRAKVDGNTIHWSIGFYPNGMVGELFIDVSREGSAIRDWMGTSAQMFSLHLQRQMPAELLVDFYLNSRSTPNGRVEHDDSWGFRIKTCTSVMDLIARTIAVAFLGREDLAEVIPKADTHGAQTQSERDRLPDTLQ